MTTPEQAVLWAALLCGAGAIATLIPRSKWLSGGIAFLFMGVAGLLVWWAVARVLMNGPGEPETFVAYPAWGFALRLHVDGLSAVFLALVATVSPAAVFFSIRYLDHHSGYGPRRFYPYLLGFIGAMVAIVSTTDTMYFFFIFWQMMTLTSYALVRFEHRRPENVRAANQYLLMMQAACALTMLGALLLAPAGPVASAGGEPVMRFDFEALALQMPMLLREQRGVVTAALLLFLVGFGIKLGIWPFGQFWLPDAHPAAPSPVSALLSGVMIKTGIYGLIRYFLWLLPEHTGDDYPVAGWGAAMVVLGGITLFVGTMQALRQEQAKRLLAYSSMGQAGYLLFGLGVCLVLLPSAHPAAPSLAALALVGVLFHTLNHGLFKSLLFLGAGSVQRATGTLDLNRLGGLLARMPWTGAAALVAALAISGVPLLNGFASKWCLFVSAIAGGRCAPYLPWAGAVAILTSAVTLACFVKWYGMIFLARSHRRVPGAGADRLSIESPWTMRLPLLLLAAACVALGLWPALALDFVCQSLQESWQALGSGLGRAQPWAAAGITGIMMADGSAAYLPLALAAILAPLVIGAILLSRMGASARRAVSPWLCGYVREANEHRLQARHYYGEIHRHFRWLGGAPPPQPQPDAASGSEALPGSNPPPAPPDCSRP
ncbi:MAG: peroxiredoxin family protein [Verrucomicrobia bacterium]|nr:peroxiredoxin family protein [Verrucomicrobiota bacterium]